MLNLVECCLLRLNKAVDDSVILAIRVYCFIGVPSFLTLLK